MSKLPQIPRRSIVLMNGGTVSHDWDKWLQALAQQVNLNTPAGTYANNAAAIAGGLLVGQVYQTATGEVRIVV